MANVILPLAEMQKLCKSWDLIWWIEWWMNRDELNEFII